MKSKAFWRKAAIVLLGGILVFQLTACAAVENTIKNIKGELIGNHFTIDFYDNFGTNVLTVDGTKVGLEANYIKQQSLNSEGEFTETKELTSVITLTVDGSQMAQAGNTVVFAEDGLQKLEDFKMPESVSTEGGTINILDRNINDIKNLMGTPKVVVICSQLGVPIAVYGGEQVYWEVPSNLPKTTKLNIDGKALYIHRANYILLDSDMIN